MRTITMTASSSLSKTLTLCLIAAALLINTSPITAAAGEDRQLVGWTPAITGCRGTVGECLLGDQEFELDSEISQRILASTSYISNEALKRNKVTCSIPGAPYYDCRMGAQANPYQPPCLKINGCRS